MRQPYQLRSCTLGFGAFSALGRLSGTRQKNRYLKSTTHGATQVNLSFMLIVMISSREYATLNMSLLL